MPFIDPEFLLDETETVHRLLITSADDSDVVSTALKVAKDLQKKGYNVLWIDGNVGEKTPEGFDDIPELERVILGQLPITHALRKKEKITVLTGKAPQCLAECSEILQ